MPLLYKELNMKVAQKIDVDGVTIRINRQNKLEAVIPLDLTLPSNQFEEVELTDYTTQEGGEVLKETYLQSFGIGNKEAKVVKLVRLKGTDYFMFKLDGVGATDTEEPTPDLPPADKPTSPTDTSNAKEHFPEGEAPKVVIDTTAYTYEISGSLKLKTAEGTYLTGMNSDTTGTLSRVRFVNYPQTNTFIFISGEYSGSVGQKQYELVSTSEGIKIQDELGTQTKSVTFNMEAPDNYGNTTQHNVTVEVRDDEIVVFGSGKTTSFGDPKDSYPAFFTDLFGYNSGDFNYVEV